MTSREREMVQTLCGDLIFPQRVKNDPLRNEQNCFLALISRDRYSSSLRIEAFVSCVLLQPVTFILSF